MIIGDLQSFAIESEITDRAQDGWTLGHFRFWVDGQAVGDWTDSTALNGCASWLDDFASKSELRYEPGLAEMSKEETFRLLFDPVIVLYGEDIAQKASPQYENIYSRFHIAHLGMSAFDRYDLLLIETEQQQRLLWRSADDLTIHEAWLPVGTMQQVAKEYCQQFALLRTRSEQETNQRSEIRE